MNYTFTLSFKLGADAPDPSTLTERLGAEGCTDALVGLGVTHQVALVFDREASSAQAALESALADCARAMPQATLLRVGPDLVDLADIAQHAGLGLQAVLDLRQTHLDNFPRPLHDGAAPVWHLEHVLRWLVATTGLVCAPGSLEMARMARHVNLVAELEDLDPWLRDGLRQHAWLGSPEALPDALPQVWSDAVHEVTTAVVTQRPPVSPPATTRRSPRAAAKSAAAKSAAPKSVAPKAVASRRRRAAA